MKWLSSVLAAIGLLFVGTLAPAPALAQPMFVNIPAPSPPVGSLVCVGGFVYAVTFVSPTTQVGQAALGGSACSSGGGSFHAYQGLYGGPNSSQFLSLREGLDMESIQIEGVDRFDVEGDADTVGVTGTYFQADNDTDGVRLEGRYEKRWRPFEGQRTRAMLNIPVQAISVDDKSNFIGVVSGGLEFPVQPNWSLTPRVAVGVSSGSEFYGGDGYIGSASLTSRYRFPQVARGDLVLGNMIAVTAESENDTQNVVLRNGLAYQYNLQQRIMGRQATARASYVYTRIEGDEVGIDDYHEIAFNIGVRQREQDVRSRFELIRFGVLVTLADFDYRAVTATAGVRF